MRIGVSLRTGYGVDDPRAGARWVVERAAAARQAGLDLLSVGDHHATGPGTYYQNVVLARLLADWPGQAGALYLLPLWHPVVVAEQVGTMAALAQGTFVLQCGIGAGRAQFAAMGVELRDRVPRFETSLDVVRRLLAGETVDSDGPWPIRGARVAPVPAEPVEVWIGASVPAAIDRAARLGDAWYAGPELTPAAAAATRREYLDRCEIHGRAPVASPIRRDVYVGASQADVERHATPVLERGYRGIDPSAVVTGTVDEVAEAFGALGEAGFDMVVARQLVDDQPAAVDSIARLGEVRRLLP